MPENDQPRRHEVLDQLNRLLSSRYFSNTDTQSKLLSLIVKSALNSEPVTQQDLNAIDGTYHSPESNHGRQNTLLMRRKVSDYYRSEGIGDLVFIDLPPGRAYKALFSYHENAASMRAFQKGVNLKRQMTRRELGLAAFIFKELTEQEPAFSPALLEHAETVMFYFLHGAALGRLSGVDDELDRSLRCADDFLNFDSNAARAYFIAGGAYLMQGNIGSAGAVFDKALELFEAETRRNLWYATYLIVTGALDSALQISGMRLAEEPDSAELVLIHKFFLYLGRRFDEAAKILSVPASSEGIKILSRLLFGLVSLGQGDFESAFHSFKWVSQLDYSEYIREQSFTEIMSPHSIVPRETLRGLEALSLAGQGRLEEAIESKQLFSEERIPQGMQLTLACIALGEMEEAIDVFERWCFDGSDPYVYLLHYLPFLDPLRTDSRFDEIVSRVRDPRRSTQKSFRIR